MKSFLRLEALVAMGLLYLIIFACYLTNRLFSKHSLRTSLPVLSTHPDLLQRQYTGSERVKW